MLFFFFLSLFASPTVYMYISFSFSSSFLFTGAENFGFVLLNCSLTFRLFAYYSRSNFVDIFDVNWFISFLAKDVTIVKRVPDKFMRSMDKPPYTMRVPRKSAPDYYLDQVLPILSRRRVRLLFPLAPRAFFRFSTVMMYNIHKMPISVSWLYSQEFSYVCSIWNLGEFFLDLVVVSYRQTINIEEDFRFCN